MPELPEVENIRRVIEPRLLGRKIIRAKLLRPDIIAYPSSEEFQDAVIGFRIKGVCRRGKYLVLMAEDGARIVLHLRMTGQLLAVPADFPEEKHTHLVFYLDDGRELRFADTRRFGRFWFLKPGEEDQVTGIESLGPEPLERDFSAKYLEEQLNRKKRPVKQALLAQGIVAGIGNIYSDEILFAAGVAPLRRCDTLMDAEWGKVAAAARDVIRKAIEDNRMTEEEYLDGKGKRYKNYEFFVYGRAGQPCKRCGTELKQVMIGGRSSVYCPKCQG